MKNEPRAYLLVRHDRVRSVVREPNHASALKSRLETTREWRRFAPLKRHSLHSPHAHESGARSDSQISAGRHTGASNSLLTFLRTRGRPAMGLAFAFVRF